MHNGNEERRSDSCFEPGELVFFSSIGNEVECAEMKLLWLEF